VIVSPACARRAAAEIVNIFHQLHHDGITIIMVTHNQELARYANRMFEMRDGQIGEIDSKLQ
jgi:ABC-type lipoprotein export system ATPase subunit